jgi:hypothetical protein
MHSCALCSLPIPPVHAMQTGTRASTIHQHARARDDHLKMKQQTDGTYDDKLDEQITADEKMIEEIKEELRKLPGHESEAIAELMMELSKLMKCVNARGSVPGHDQYRACPSTPLEIWKTNYHFWYIDLHTHCV